MATERIELAKAHYRAFSAGDRDAVEGLLGEEFEFHSPADEQGLDRAGWFSAAGRAPAASRSSSSSA